MSPPAFYVPYCCQEACHLLGLKVMCQIRRLGRPEIPSDLGATMPGGMKADDKALWARVDALSR